MLDQTSAMKIAYVSKITATTALQSYTPTATNVRAYNVIQKSTNRAHIGIRGISTATNNGTLCVSVEATLDNSYLLHLVAADLPFTYIRDGSASGDATIEIWEMVL